VEVIEDVDKKVKDAFHSDLYGQIGKYGTRKSHGLRFVLKLVSSL